MPAERWSRLRDCPLEVTFIQPTEYYRLATEGTFHAYPDADTDGDGLQDGVEGQGDAGNDGISDLLDPDPAP